MITAATLDAIAASVRQNPDIAPLRQHYPDLIFSSCSEDDIPARVPSVLDAGAYLLYLVSSPNGHCLSLTNDLEAATGVVVAAKADDE